MRASVLDVRAFQLLCSSWNGSSTVGIRLLGEDEEMVSTGSDRRERSGEVNPEVTDAITAYARSHLLQEVDKFSGYSSARWALEVGPTIGSIRYTHSSHRYSFFATIEVTPQGTAGEIDVAQHEKFEGPCTWGAEIEYCYRVSTEHGEPTVLIKKFGSLIN